MQLLLFGQETAQNISQETGIFSINLTDILLLLIALFLLLPIYYLSRIINWSLKHYLEQVLNKKTINSILLILAFSIPAYLSAQSADPQMQTPISDAAGSMNILRGFLLVFIFSEVIVILLFSAIIFKQFNLHQVNEITKETELQKDNAILRWWNKMNNFGKIEDEASIDTGHNYDGIRELDNKIPAWFTAIFISTVLFGVSYMWIYHIAKISPLSEQEYIQEEEEAAIAHEVYLKTAGSQVDENKLVFTLDKASIENGKKLFIANCAACHLADGGGNQGPNLVDENWIYGCTPKDIYQSIKYGRPKGMQAWKNNFNDKQILEISEFVHSLNGTKPSVSKEPQGAVCNNTVITNDTTNSK